MQPAVLLLSIALLTSGAQTFEDDDGGGTLRIPMYRKEKSTLPSLTNFLRTKFNNEDFEELEGTSEIDVIVQNYLNFEYYGEVTFGTPPQKFQMAFETGQRHILIPSENCYNCLRQRYNSSASSTYEAQGNKISFPDWTKGFLSRDTVCVGGQCMTGEYFIEVTFAGLGFQSDDAKADGVIGMTPSEKTTLGVDTFFQSLLEQKKIIDPVFAFWFNRKANESGELVLGGVDKRRYVEPITYVNLTGQNNWQIHAEGVMVNSSVVSCANKCKVEIDTGSPFIMSGMVETDAIHKPLGFKYWPITYGKMYYVQNCTEEMKANYMDVTFVIDGKKYVIPSKDYLFVAIGPDGLSYCVSYIFGVAIYDYYDWTLGIPFMGKYYTIFDFGQKRVGFAEAKQVKKEGLSKKSKSMTKLWQRMQMFGREALLPF